MHTVYTHRQPKIDKELSTVAAALEQQRRFRLEQVRELDEVIGAAAPAHDDDAHDEVNRLLRKGAVAALKEVDDALHRLQAGTYAVCERCSGSIAKERLEVLPMARYCMRCQRVLESRRS